MDSDLSVSTCQDSSSNDSTSMDLDFDSADDGSISDIEDDPEAFYAVFPHAPTLVSNHALRPLVKALRQLITQRDHLLVALLPSEDSDHVGPQDVAMLEAKARFHMQTRMDAVLSPEDWQRITDFLKRRVNHDDRWTPKQLVQQVDEMMLKLALYYAHLWKHVSSAAVVRVYKLETTISKLYAEWTDAARGSDRLQPKLPPLDSVYRPLRLRSHTAAAAASATSPTPPTPADSQNVSEAAVAAHRRARLARQSNEFLIAWFLHHKAKPYPSQAERVQIAKKTGLTEQQVRNWFANMRKRHWKPKDPKSAKKPRSLIDLLLRKSEPTNK